MLPFGIGFSEVLLILVVVLLVVGPQKLPEIARTLGKGIRTARRAGQELRSAIEFDDIRRSVYDNTVRPWQQATDIEDAQLEPRRPTGGFTGAAASAAAAVEAATEVDDPMHDPDEAAPSGPVARGPAVSVTPPPAAEVEPATGDHPPSTADAPVDDKA